MTSDIYREVILDHYRHPRNFGKLEKPDIRVKDANPLCGDVIELTLKVQDSRIEDVKFNGQGCAISQAAASMLTEAIKGKTVEEAKAFGKDDMLKALGIEVGPTRIKCALLALKTLKTGVYAYLGQKLEERY